MLHGKRWIWTIGIAIVIVLGGVSVPAAPALRAATSDWPAGTWYAHSTRLQINSDGSGSFSYRLASDCPVAQPSNGFFCNVIDTIRVTPHGSSATLTVLTSKVGWWDVTGKQLTDQIPGVTAGTQYALSRHSPGTSSLDMSGRLLNGSQPRLMCLSGSPEERQSKCGA